MVSHQSKEMQDVSLFLRGGHMIPLAHSATRPASSALAPPTWLPLRTERACNGTPPSQPRRVLVYCLQSSGCTLFTLLLAQASRSIAILDLFIVERAPCPDEFVDVRGIDWIFLKMTVRTETVDSAGVRRRVRNPLERFSSIVRTYQPHAVFFFLRDQGTHPSRLTPHSWSDVAGWSADKAQHWRRLLHKRRRLANQTFSFAGLCSDMGRTLERLEALGLRTVRDGVRLHVGVEGARTYRLSRGADAVTADAARRVRGRLGVTPRGSVAVSGSFPAFGYAGLHSSSNITCRSEGASPSLVARPDQPARGSRVRR